MSLAVVLVVALVVGSGIGRSHPSAAQRAEAIEALIRCPSCEDLSVLDSSASTAVSVRHQIARQVAEGRTDQQIEDALVARYGPTILLSPPTRGLSALVWIVPALAGLGALVAVAMLFWRRSRRDGRVAPGGPMSGRRPSTVPPPGADRWRLNDERQFLVRSLEDADLEHAAGDLSDDDYAVLSRRDRARLADVEESLALLGPEVTGGGDGNRAIPPLEVENPAEAESAAAQRRPTSPRRAGGFGADAVGGSPGSAWQPSWPGPLSSSITWRPPSCRDRPSAGPCSSTRPRRSARNWRRPPH